MIFGLLDLFLSTGVHKPFLITPNLSHKFNFTLHALESHTFYFTNGVYVMGWGFEE